MREIMFRGKSTLDGKWVFGSYKKFYGYHVSDIHNHICTYDGANIYEVEESTVGQYTGLKDKKGKEIYEGDILDLTYFLTKEKGIVKFGQYKNWSMSNDYECGNQGFYVDVTNDEHKAWRNDLWFYHSNCEIIGNIYENPELLEVPDAKA